MVIFWFRRDLRLNDNTALYQALKSGKEVQPIFIFDVEILEKLEDKTDARVSFIHSQIARIKQELNEIGSDLWVFHGKPMEVFNHLIHTHKIDSIFTNHDYEPYAKQRDEAIKKLTQNKNIALYTFKDQCIFEKDEIIKDDGKPYTVFTPYSRKWKDKLNASDLKPYPTSQHFNQFHKSNFTTLVSLQEMGFKQTLIKFPEQIFDKDLIINYKEQRDYPAMRGTSRLSLHLRFGTISIRALGAFAKDLSEGFINELIWRDFYMMILWHFPHVVNRAFKPAYDKIAWRNDPHEFEAWCTGKTGYPIVDAGMRELNETGFMHNRVRMIVASFLTKHLLIDWRWGEAYFAAKLLDFELSSNNGGWQWAASSGCDAAPYFRVFNPDLQTQKFDPKFSYIRKWVPEFEDFTRYPKPIVDHKFARERVLNTYKKALS